MTKQGLRTTYWLLLNKHDMTVNLLEMLKSSSGTGTVILTSSHHEFVFFVLTRWTHANSMSTQQSNRSCKIAVVLRLPTRIQYTSTDV